MYHIYKITNQINRKSYVGITSKTPEVRWKSHQYRASKGSHTHFHRAIQKYGAATFLLTILEKGDDLKVGLLREQHWITTTHAQYNETAGGQGCLSPSLSARKKMGRDMKGPNNPFFRKSHSQTTRDIIGKKNSGKTRSKNWRGLMADKNTKEGNPMWGRSHTNQTIEVFKKINSGCGNPMFGKTQPLTSCIFCRTAVGVNAIPRWHGETCRSRRGK
jgi:group I intron endonuclease